MTRKVLSFTLAIVIMLSQFNTAFDSVQDVGVTPPS